MNLGRKQVISRLAYRAELRKFVGVLAVCARLELHSGLPVVGCLLACRLSWHCGKSLSGTRGFFHGDESADAGPSVRADPPAAEGCLSDAKRFFSSSAIASTAADRRHRSRARASSLECSAANRRIERPCLIVSEASSRRSSVSLIAGADFHARNATCKCRRTKGRESA